MNPDGSIRATAKQPTMEKEELLQFYKLMVLLNVCAAAKSCAPASASPLFPGQAPPAA